MTVGFVFGTRPEVTKAIGIARSYAEMAGSMICAIATGQQTNLVRSALCDYDAQSFADITWLANQDLKGQDPHWERNFEPELRRIVDARGISAIVGTGDTRSVLVSAIFCGNNGLPFIHLEAGIRHVEVIGEFEPEESNRRRISKLADFHCCPTARQRSLLLSEGFHMEVVHVLGDLSTLAVSETWRARRRRASTGTGSMVPLSTLVSRPLCLCTFHRSTSVLNMDMLIDRLCSDLADYPFVTFLVCRRPDTRWDRFYEHLDRIANVLVTDAPGPLAFQGLLCHCDFVITDSAGVQQEALLLNKPVVALRANIELLEGHPLLEVVRPPYHELPRALLQALSRISSSRQLDITLHCQAGDMIAGRGAYLIQTFAPDLRR